MGCDVVADRRATSESRRGQCGPPGGHMHRAGRAALRPRGRRRSHPRIGSVPGLGSVAGSGGVPAAGDMVSDLGAVLEARDDGLTRIGACRLRPSARWPGSPRRRPPVRCRPCSQQASCGLPFPWCGEGRIGDLGDGQVAEADHCDVGGDRSACLAQRAQRSHTHVCRRRRTPLPRRGGSPAVRPWRRRRAGPGCPVLRTAPPDVAASVSGRSPSPRPYGPSDRPHAAPSA